jgi:hypothetical protein
MINKMIQHINQCRHSKGLVLVLLLITSLWKSPSLFAQQDISISVHINRLGDGSFPTKLYQFSNIPGLVQVILINHDNTTQTIFLDGTLTGDNGVKVVTAKNYQPSSITLGPLQTKTLNAIEAGNLFDPNKLMYVSGSTDIKPSVLGEQALPEGTYQVCIRAYDAVTRNPLSEEEPIGCSNIFSVATLEPPVILNPADEDSLPTTGIQNIPFRWSTPPGAPPSTEYTIRLVEMFGEQNPNNAMQSTAIPFFETTVRGTPVLLYSMQYPRLQEGRSYAMMVTAKDPSNNATFRNNGRSEVIAFAYGKLKASVASLTIDASGNVNCGCKAPSGDTKVKTDLSAIQAGSKLTIDGFDLMITSITNKSDGKINGEGKIAVPVLKFVPVSVSLQNIQINNGNEVIAGKAVAKRRSDAASLLPDYDPMQPNLTINPAQTQNFGQYISNYITSNLDPQQALGYSLPLGISNATANNITVAVTNMVFTPQQAYFDAGAALDIPEASMTVALGGRGICFSKDKTLCGQAALYLARDLDVATTGIVLKAMDASDEGTFIEFGIDGFKRLRIRGEYTLPENQFEKKGGGLVKAQLTVEAAESWANWIASVNIDPFHLKGDDNFEFLPGTAFYDHSDKQNPPGIPVYYEEVIEPGWRGFFIPELQVELPSFIKKFTGSDKVVASAQNFIIDAQGLSGSLGVDNIIGIDEGALSTWQYSLDRIEVVFKKNSFVGGDMKGRILLPIASAEDPNSQLNYTCTLAVTNGLNFNFVVQPKDNIDIPMWIVHMDIDKSSHVDVTAGSAGTKVSAVLTGDITVKAQLPGIDQVDIKAISFQNLTLNSSAPYISDGQLVTGQSSPDKFINGFPIAFREPPKLSSDKLGLEFSFEITLADIPGMPKASTAFTITGGFDLVNGRLKTQAPKFFLNEIGLDGWIGPVKVKGSVHFIDNDPVYGDGIEGVLNEATFPPGFTIKASAFFGRKDNYRYFFVGANFNLPPPAIPIGGGIIPLSIYGFGGGLYYNMTLKQDPMKVQHISEADPKTMYIPSKGIAGFRGSMTLGTSDGSIFVAIGTLSAEINYSTLALNKIAINVDAGMYTRLADINNAMIQGSGFMQYDFAADEFTTSITMNINLPGGFIKGSGALGMLANFNSGDWYFKMGDPVGDRISLTLSAFDLVKFNFKAYQNIGNKLRLPDRLQAAYDAAAGRLITTGSYTNPITRQSQPVTKVGGMLFGASASAEMDLEFLIFYLKMKAELGFDLALLQNASKCTDGSPMGLDGYYALGDLYASGSFDFGLNVNVWFFKGKVSAAEVGFSTTLQAGFANPFMFDGWLEADYKLLEGLVSGHMNFHVKYSSAGDGGCVIAGNPFGDMPLISDIVPHDGDHDVSVFISTGAAFNFPVNQEFSVTIRNEKGENELKKLKVVINSFSLTNNKTGQVYSASMDVSGNMFSVQNGGKINASSHNAWLYGWAKTLDPQTDFTVAIIADGYEWNLQGGWKKVDGATDTKTAAFKTGDCIKTLDEQGAVLATYPFRNQRYFLPKHYTNGYIYLKLATDCLESPPSKSDAQGFTAFYNKVARYDIYAIFDSEKDHFESLVSNDGQMLKYPIPDQLSAATVYRIRIVKRPVMNNNANLASAMHMPGNPANAALKQVNIAKSIADQSDNNVMKNSLFIEDHQAIAALSVASASDIEIYKYYFRTSRYKTLQEKTQGVFQDGATTWPAGWGGTGPIPNFNVFVREGLDQYDAKGLFIAGKVNDIAQTASGANVFIPPIFNFDENYYDNTWMQQVIFPISQQYLNIAPFDAERAQHSKWRLLAPAGGNMTFIKDAEPFQVNSFDAVLSENEIPLGLKVPNFIVTSPAGINTSSQPASPALNNNLNGAIKK